MSYPSGLYKIVRNDGSDFTIYLNKSQANFMNNAFIKLGFKQIGVIKEVHVTDFPRWGRF